MHDPCTPKAWSWWDLSHLPRSIPIYQGTPINWHKCSPPGTDLTTPAFQTSKGVHYIHIWVSQLENWHIQLCGCQTFFTLLPSSVVVSAMCLTHCRVPIWVCLTSFDTLYMLAKKMKAQQPSCLHRSGSGFSDTHRNKYRRYPAPKGWVAMLGEEELLPPDPALPDSKMSKPDVIEGLSLRMTQTMNHYQRDEHCCFVCGATNHSARETFHAWHREHFNSKGVGPQQKVPTPKIPPWK